jgi:hypothetical protein
MTFELDRISIRQIARGPFRFDHCGEARDQMVRVFYPNFQGGACQSTAYMVELPITRIGSRRLGGISKLPADRWVRGSRLKRNGDSTRSAAPASAFRYSAPFLRRNTIRPSKTTATTMHTIRTIDVSIRLLLFETGSVHPVWVTHILSAEGERNNTAAGTGAWIGAKWGISRSKPLCSLRKCAYAWVWLGDQAVRSGSL